MPVIAARAPAPRGEGSKRAHAAAVWLAVLVFAAVPRVLAAQVFDPLHPERGEAWAKSAQTPADMALLTRINLEVERLAALWSDSDLRFAVLAEGEVRPVAKGADWPENFTEAIVLYREDGRTRVVVREPQSESGDWALTYIQYFDAEGRTIRFERAYSRIDPYCGDTPAPGGVAREAALSSFGPGLRLIDRRYAVDAVWQGLRARLKLPAGM